MSKSGKREYKWDFCKPCWELGYCPYGAIVEELPLRPDETDLSEIEKRYGELLERLLHGDAKSEQEILETVSALLYYRPQTWRDLARYDCTELSCNALGHVCPVIYAEPATETRAARRTGRTIPREMMLKVVRRDGQVCQICGRNVRDDELEFDHIIPLAKGGPTSVSNLQVVCADCNRKKSDELPDMFWNWDELREKTKRRKIK